MVAPPPSPPAFGREQRLCIAVQRGGPSGPTTAHGWASGELTSSQNCPEGGGRFFFASLGDLSWKSCEKDPFPLPGRERGQILLPVELRALHAEVEAKPASHWLPAGFFMSHATTSGTNFLFPMSFVVPCSKLCFQGSTDFKSELRI